MISSPYVLVVSTIADVATDDVVKRLSARSVAFRRVNTENFPFTDNLAFRPGAASESFWLEHNGEALPLPTTIWYRRVRSPARPNEMEPGVYDFCLQEARTALIGSLLTAQCRWMSHPASIWGAEYKPFQLSVAARLGLSIPRTVITNRPDAIRDAFHEFDAMVVKPVRSGYVVHGGKDHAIYTSRVDREHLDHLADAQLSPAIYQELIRKKFDIRVTIVGRKVFAAAIDSQSDPNAEIDWRHTTNPDLPHRVHHLPFEISNKLLALKDVLNLEFAAIDLVQTANDDYVFLEANPNGQWLWIDDKLELGISDAMAEWLSRATE